LSARILLAALSDDVAYAAMELLEKESATIRSLSTKLHVSTGKAHKLLRRLEELGLAERLSEKGGFKITPLGARMMNRIRAVEEELRREGITLVRRKRSLTDIVSAGYESFLAGIYDIFRSLPKLFLLILILLALLNFMLERRWLELLLALFAAYGGSKLYDRFKRKRALHR
jgi:predicted transcriptional regulator